MFKKLAQISYLFKDSHFFFCTETWLLPILNDSLIQIQGKSIFRRDRSSLGGSVCIYVDNDLSPYCTFNVKSSYIGKDLEIISLDVKKPGLKYMKVACIYRPPRGDPQKCIEKITEILSRRKNSKKKYGSSEILILII